MRRTIRIERVLPHPPERVWRALTDSKLLGKWFMENDLQPELHHAFRFRKAPQRGWDGLTHCEVLALEPLRRIGYSYRGKATGEKALRCAGVESTTAGATVKGIFAELDTVLEFRLTPEVGPDGRERTRLFLEHRGFSGLKLIIVSFVMGFGWSKKVLPRMTAVLEELERAEARA